jgi:hypothetical protein
MSGSRMSFSTAANSVKKIPTPAGCATTITRAGLGLIFWNVWIFQELALQDMEPLVLAGVPLQRRPDLWRSDNLDDGDASIASGPASLTQIRSPKISRGPAQRAWPGFETKA